MREHQTYRTRLQTVRGAGLEEASYNLVTAWRRLQGVRIRLREQVRGR